MDCQNKETCSQRFSKSQIDALKEAYLINNHITGERRQELAQKTNLTETQIRDWFSNRRLREKSTTNPTIQQKLLFKKAQLDLLNDAFVENNYVRGDRKRELAVATDLTEAYVAKWFKTKRSKGRENSDSHQNPHLYTRAQYDILNAAFLENNYAKGGRKEQLAKETGLTESQVATWFTQHRTTHLKRSDLQYTAPVPYTTAQYEILHKAFAEHDYIEGERKTDFAKRANLTEKQVSTWFKNRRRNLKKNCDDGLEYGQVEPINVTPDQEEILMEMFLKYRFLNMGELADMVKRTGLEEEQVKEWFKRQRELVGEEEMVIKEEPEDEME